MRCVNFSKFKDEFGNLNEEFEVVEFEKNADGEWKENKRFESGRSYYVIDSQLYYRSGDSLIELNMDFDSKNCGMCYQVGDEIKNERKITGNEVLFIYKANSLHRQNYSDGTCFYSLKDHNGNCKLNYGSKDLKNIIKQLEHEREIYKNNGMYDNPDIINVHDDIITEITKMINDFEMIASER